MLTLRFDMRAPATGAPVAELYAAALGMAEWGERHGSLTTMVSEHHGSSDGYLPAPLVLASAVAARTKTQAIQVAALLVPLHDPIDLAEQMAVLDILSGGRVSYVVALGYRESEYAMFGRDMKRRGRRMEECLAALQQAWTGEPFTFEGRPVHVTPRPTTPGGPMLLMGGSHPAAIRRAARFGIGMITLGGDASLEEIYRAECEKAGTTPGLFVNPPPDAPTSLFVAEDPERAWSEIGPYLLHDATMYGEWMGDGGSASGSLARSVGDLRAENGNYRIVTPDDAIAMVRGGMPLMLQPLCGGLPPKIAWSHLELVERAVLPALGGE